MVTKSYKHEGGTSVSPFLRPFVMLGKLVRAVGRGLVGIVGVLGAVLICVLFPLGLLRQLVSPSVSTSSLTLFALCALFLLIVMGRLFGCVWVVFRRVRTRRYDHAIRMEPFELLLIPFMAMAAGWADRPELVFKWGTVSFLALAIEIVSLGSCFLLHMLSDVLMEARGGVIEDDPPPLPAFTLDATDGPTRAEYRVETGVAEVQSEAFSRWVQDRLGTRGVQVRPGERLEFREDTKVEYTVFWRVPFQSGGVGVIPAGEILTVVDMPSGDRDDFLAIPDRYWDIQAMVVPERDRCGRAYDGFAIRMFLHSVDRVARRLDEDAEEVDLAAHLAANEAPWCAFARPKRERSEWWDRLWTRRVG